MPFGPVGNLVFDGNYVYQYDAWNCLAQSNEAGTLTSIESRWNPMGKHPAWMGSTSPRTPVERTFKGALNGR